MMSASFPLFPSSQRLLNNFLIIVIDSTSRWLVPMTQHLTECIVPLSDKGVCEFINLFGRWSVATPHRRLRSLISRVVWYKLTRQDEKVSSLVDKELDVRTHFVLC